MHRKLKIHQTMVDIHIWWLISAPWVFTKFMKIITPYYFFHRKFFLSWPDQLLKIQTLQEYLISSVYKAAGPSEKNLWSDPKVTVNAAVELMKAWDSPLQAKPNTIHRLLSRTWARVVFGTWFCFHWPLEIQPLRLCSPLLFARWIKWQVIWKSSGGQITNIVWVARGHNYLHREPRSPGYISTYSAFSILLPDFN